MEKRKWVLLILYFLFFIVLCGRITVEILIFGAVISAAMVYANTKKISRRKAKLSFSAKKLLVYIQFVFLLVKEIITANINVALILIKPRIVISPCIIKHRTRLKNSYSRVVLANTITLTPGTITIDLEDDELMVHCLSQSFASGVFNSRLERLLIKLEE